MSPAEARVMLTAGQKAQAIRLISFGYLHLKDGPPPAADRVEDVRSRLRDPAAAQGILDLDGRHPRVQEIVLRTPGARELLANLADYAALPAGPQSIAIGCAGGKHRASALTELLGRELRERGHSVEIEHLHVHLPRVLKPGVTHATTAGAAGPPARTTGLDQRFDALDGIPARDDPEVTALMVPARRLPRDRMENCLESLLRCSLGYQRTGDPEFMTRLASSTVTSLRCRRNPEDQAALDAPPTLPAGPAGTLDVEDMLRARGL